jgi:hypothetical protein
MNPETLLEGPEDPIAELINQAHVDVAAYVSKGGELRTRKEPPQPAESSPATVKPRAGGDGARGPDFSKLAKLASEMGLQGVLGGVAEVVLAASELIEKAFTAVELLELKALESKLAIEVELQGLIAQQVRGWGSTGLSTRFPSPVGCARMAFSERRWPVLPLTSCDGTCRDARFAMPTRAPPASPAGAATGRRVRLHAEPDRDRSGHDQG